MTLDRRTLLAAGAGAGLVALGGGAWTLLRQPGRAGEPSVDDVLHDPDQPVLGNLQGDLTIAEFFDYQCPFCKRGHPDLMAEVEADGNIRLVMKDWPIFGGASVLAAQMVLGAADHEHYAAAQSALRTGLQKLLRDARAGGSDLVIAEALDRLSRNQADIATIYERLQFDTVIIETLAEGQVSELHIGLKGTMNALFLKDLATKTRRGLKGRALQGRSAGGLTYGYVPVMQLEAQGERIRG